MKKADRELYQKHLNFLAMVIGYVSPPRGKAYYITHSDQPATSICVDSPDGGAFEAKIAVNGSTFETFAVFGSNRWEKRVVALAKRYGFKESVA